MNWITIYITGKADFREDVRKKLEHADLNFMPGYTGNSSSDINVHDLYWIDERTDLRSLKLAIGGKLIWKYRLRFYASLEAFVESQNPAKNSTEFTEDELNLLAEVQETAEKHN